MMAALERSSSSVGFPFGVQRLKRYSEMACCLLELFASFPHLIDEYLLKNPQ